MRKNTVPFVLALAADSFGCGHHRIFWPSQWISKAGIALANPLLGNIVIDQLIESKPDVIVFQRQVEKHQIGSIKNLRQALGEGGQRPALVWEIDDLLTNVPTDSVHEPFQAPASIITDNIREVLGYMDWAVVPTEPLAEWLRGIRPGTEVRVVPNLIEELDSDSLPKIESPAPSLSAKHKISWAGGISHVGDLKLIELAIHKLEKENIKWNFMGLRPEGDFGKADITFHPGVTPQEFMKVYLEQGHELVLAPLEDHPFNDAKSNLRLIQAGAAGAAVIASPAYPYRDKNPPVFAYCSSPEEWAVAIKKWIDTPAVEKLEWRKKMRAWAKGWSVKNNLELLAHGWGLEVPKAQRLGSPKNRVVVAEKPEMVWLPESEMHRVLFEPDIEKANEIAIKENYPLLLVRPGTILGRESLAKMVQFLRQNNAASVCGLSNDGVFGFDFLSNPQNPQFTMIDSELNETIGTVVANSKLTPKVLPAPLGPVVLINPEVLAKMPVGKTAFDWGLLMAVSGHRNFLLPDVWAFASQTEPQTDQVWLKARNIDIGKIRDMFPPEERLLLEAKTIKAQRLYTVPSAPNDIQAWKAIQNKQNTPATDVAVLKLGDQDGLDRAKRLGIKWLFWESPNIKLETNFDGELEKTGNEKSADVVYCDAVGPQNSSSFRPEHFDEELFKAWDYISGCCLIRVELWDWGAPVGRGEIFKRLLEMARDGRNFVHCPKVLCEETDTPDDESRVQSVREIFPGYSANLYSGSFGKPPIKGLIEVKKKLVGAPSVSLVILTSGDTWVLRPALATILRRTEYKGDWNIILGRSGPKKGDPNTLAELSDPRITYVELGEGTFNWSILNNKLFAEYVKSDYAVFVNDDVRVLDKTWLPEMIAYAQMETVGFVGIRLVFPADGSVQHVGVYCDRGVPFHIHKHWHGHMPGYWGYARANHESTAVTGACVAISSEKFARLGMFPEQYAYNFGDVTACLNANRAGLKNICVCVSELQHAESSTRPAFNDENGMKLLRREGELLQKEYHEKDIYWNPNLKITIHPNRFMSNGGNFEIINWDMDKPAEKIILLLNTVEPVDIIKYSDKNVKVIVGVAEHGRLMLVRPGLANSPALELQNKSLIGMLLREMGVTEVIEAKETMESSYVKSCLQ